MVDDGVFPDVAAVEVVIAAELDALGGDLRPAVAEEELLRALAALREVEVVAFLEMAHVVGGQVAAAQELVLQRFVETFALHLCDEEVHDGLRHHPAHLRLVNKDVDRFLAGIVTERVEAVHGEVVVQACGQDAVLGVALLVFRLRPVVC